MSLKVVFKELTSRFSGLELDLNPPAKQNQFAFLDELDDSFDISQITELYKIANGQSLDGSPLFSMNYFEDISRFAKTRPLRLTMSKNDLNDKLTRGETTEGIIKGIEQFNCSKYWDEGWITIGSSEYSSHEIVVDIDKRRKSFGNVGLRELEDFSNGYTIANSIQHFFEVTISLVDENEMTDVGCSFVYPRCDFQIC